MPTATLQPSTPTSRSGTVEYITVEEAARLLDKAPRTILGMAKEEKIRSIRQVTPESRGQKVTMIHAGDVAAQADPGRRAEKLLEAGSTAGAQVVRSPAAVPAPLQTDTVNPYSIPAPAPRPWLTLDESAQFSGLTKRWLLEQAETVHQDGPLHSTLSIRDMGKHSPGGRWRFHRESLERA